jgi:DNA-binding beta-propeller fold protein YncE
MWSTLCTLSLAVAGIGQEADSKLGAYQSEIAELGEPSAVVVLPDGSLAVLESSFDRIKIVDLDGTERRTLGGPGAEPGQFHGARAMVAGPNALLWVADTGNHRVQAFDNQGVLVHVFGSFGPEPGQLNRPTGLAVDARYVYVADTLNDRIQTFTHDGEPQLGFGTWGSEPGELNHPLDVAVDDAGNLYVADGDNHRIQKFDPNGVHVASWGDFGPHPGFFATPTGITFHDGRLFVADHDNHRIQVFDTEGEPAYTWGLHAIRPRESQGKLHYPRSVAVSPDGELAVVAEAFEDRVQIFGLTKDGAEPPAATALERSTSTHYGPHIGVGGGLMALVEPTRPGLKLFDIETDVGGMEPINITAISSWGRRFGQMLRPADAAIDVRKNWLWVCDPALRKIEVWRIDRDEGPIKYQPFLLKLAFSVDLNTVPRNTESSPIEVTAIELDPDGTLLVIDARRRALAELVWEEELDGPGLLFFSDAGIDPVDLALSPDAHIVYVADHLDGSIRRYRRGILAGPDEPRELEKWTRYLRRPNGIAVDDEGFVYVSDAVYHAVLKFTPEGDIVERFGSKGLLKVEFFKPGGIAIRSDGRLIVMDDGNHRGQILTTDGEFVHAFGSRLFTRPIRQQQ